MVDCPVLSRRLAADDDGEREIASRPFVPLAMTAAVLLSLPACSKAPPAAAALFPVINQWVASVDSPVVDPMVTDGERVYVATEGGTVRALDAKTGAILWQQEPLPGVLAHGSGTLLVRGADGAVTALDAANSSLRWTAASEVPGTLPPVVDGTRVLIAGEGLAALDLASGRVLFRTPLERPAMTPPQIAGPCLLMADDRALRCRRPEDGSPLWSFPLDAPLDGPPAADGARVYFGSGRGVFAVTLADGSRDWRWPVGAAVIGAPVVHEDRVLVTTHEAVLYSISRGSGTMVWRVPLPSRSVSGPLVVGGRVLAATRDALQAFETKTAAKAGRHEVRVLRLDPREGRVEITGAPLLVGEQTLVPTRNPFAVIAMIAGKEPVVPAAPDPFPPDLSESVAFPETPTPTPTVTPSATATPTPSGEEADASPTATPAPVDQ